MLARYSGEVCDKGSYVSVKTPDNPEYRWGNYLIFDSAPRKGALPRWQEIFRQEFAQYQGVRHMCFTWDTPDLARGDTQEFEEAGFELQTTSTLTARKVVAPPKMNQDVEIKPVTKEPDFEEVIQTQLLYRPDGHDVSSYETFIRRQMSAYRKMTDSGIGTWHGAFLENRLVGSLALFVDGEIATFQNVYTHPEFARRGICGRLVHEVAGIALNYRGIGALAVDADANYHAERIYKSMGFVHSETTYGLEWSEDTLPKKSRR